MAEIPDILSIEQKLSAFADGELDAAQRLEVLDHLTEHPGAIQRVRDQQRLSLAARRVMGDPKSTASKTLRNRIEMLAPTPMTRQSGGGGVGKFWWTGLAACALIAVGIVIQRVRSPLNQIAQQTVVQQMIPASYVARASGIHADCSRLADALHSAGFPQDQGPLASHVESDLHSENPYPNLSSIGFHYVGAGPCGDHLPETIHLLYHSSRPGLRHAISLFVQPFYNQFSVDAGKTYKVSSDDSPFPMLLWRTDRVVYYLIADDETLEQRALLLIKGDGAETTLPSK